MEEYMGKRGSKDVGREERSGGLRLFALFALAGVFLGLMQVFFFLFLDEFLDGFEALGRFFLDDLDALFRFLGGFARLDSLIFDLLARFLAAGRREQDTEDEARGRSRHERQEGIPEMSVLVIPHGSSPFFF